jgi:hypothetical protein
MKSQSGLNFTVSPKCTKTLVFGHFGFYPPHKIAIYANSEHLNAFYNYFFKPILTALKAYLQICTSGEHFLAREFRLILFTSLKTIKTYK